MTGGRSEALRDDAARRDVAGRLDANLFVEAGAGSGKTSSLVERVVTLVTKGGVDVADIAAITFTEAAARELRTRVRDRLVAEGIDGAEVEAATFTTLHSFALRILLTHPVEAGLPPGFAVLDEVRSVLDFERGWREFQGRLGDDLGLLELQQRAGALDSKLTDRLSAIARSFDENWDRVDAIREAIESEVPNSEQWDAARPTLTSLDFTDEIEAVIGLAQHCDGCTNPDDKLVEQVQHLVGQLRSIKGNEPIDQLRELAHLKPNRRKVGRKGDWRSPTVDEMRELTASALAGVDAAVNGYRQEVLAAMQRLVEIHVAGEVRRRHGAGMVSFHDLLVLAKLLVRGNEPIRRRLHDRYRCILLDEFQDTDPLQIELAAVIASPSAPGDRPWQELLDHLEPGRLTVVGDPKQSIYRFRRADMGVYLQTGESLADGATELSTNFRSVPGIVDFVNAFFVHRFISAGGSDPAVDTGGEGSSTADRVDGYRRQQPPYRPLVAHREPCPSHLAARVGVDDDRPVIVLGRQYDKEDANAERLRDLEATDIANLVCTIAEDGWPVYRRDLDQWGDARLADIAILIPSRLSLPSLETAFQAANIPLRPETNSLVYATQEIRDVMSAVRAVVDPGSAIDVAAALRSSLFAIDDESLLRWKLAGGSWDYRSPAPTDFAGSEIDRAFDDLRRWRNQRWWTEPAHLVDEIVQQRRLRELALLYSRPRDRLRRYRFLAEQARLFAETEAGDLGDFVEWVEIQSSDLARITEPVPPEPDDDAVRVLTVHGAKGLEFPIAVMAGAPTDVSGSRPASVLYTDRESQPGSDPNPESEPDPDPDSPSSSMEIRLSVDNQTEGFDARASAEKVLDAQERIRLQYVAATRARDYLIVCTHHNNRGTSVGRETWKVLEEIPDSWSAFSPEPNKVFRDEPTQLRIPEGDFTKVRDSWLREQELVLDAKRSDARWSATRVASVLAGGDPRSRGADGESEELLHEANTDGEDAPAEHAGGLGADFGTAVHHVLELIPFSAGQQPTGSQEDLVHSLSEGCAARAGVPSLSSQVASRVSQALESDALRLASNGRHWRELAVSLAWPGGTFDGIIDLVVETGDGLVLIDYKTDLLRPESLEADLSTKVARYRHQLAAYAVAVERLIPDQSVVDCRLLFLTDAGVHERSVPDLPAAKIEVAELLGINNGSDASAG